MYTVGQTIKNKRSKLQRVVSKVSKDGKTINWTSKDGKKSGKCSDKNMDRWVAGKDNS